MNATAPKTRTPAAPAVDIKSVRNASKGYSDVVVYAVKGDEDRLLKLSLFSEDCIAGEDILQKGEAFFYNLDELSRLSVFWKACSGERRSKRHHFRALHDAARES